MKKWLGIIPVFVVVCVILRLLLLDLPAIAADSPEKTQLHWLTAVFPDTETEMVLNEVNRLLNDLPEPMEIVLVDWTKSYDYILYLQTALASGDDQIDLIAIASNMGFFKYAAEGAFEDISPFLDAYGYVIRTIPDEKWKLTTFGPSIYGIPTDTIFNAKGTAMALLSADWEGAPTDPQELLNWITYLNEEDGSVLVDDGGTESATPPFFLHYTYDEWPFDVDAMGIFYFDSEGNVSPYIESPIYRLDSGWMREFRNAGVLVSPDSEAGYNIAGVLGGAFSQKMYANRQDYTYFIFDSDAVSLANGDRMYNVIPSGADPELALRFFDWLYSDAEHYHLLLYGIPDTHYHMDEYGFPVSITDEKGYPLYWNGAAFDCQAQMITPNEEYFDMIFTEYGMTETEYYESVNPGTTMPFTGFTFDPEPVRQEYDRLLAVMKSGLYARIRDGFESMSLLDDAIDELKSADLDTVMAECERQYEEFKSAMWDG